jgi:hypothetical protein
MRLIGAHIFSGRQNNCKLHKSATICKKQTYDQIFVKATSSFSCNLQEHFLLVGIFILHRIKKVIKIAKLITCNLKIGCHKRTNNIVNLLCPAVLRHFVSVGQRWYEKKIALALSVIKYCLVMKVFICQHLCVRIKTCMHKSRRHTYPEPHL